jgi:hypothetical protein
VAGAPQAGVDDDVVTRHQSLRTLPGTSVSIAGNVGMDMLREFVFHRRR